MEIPDTLSFRLYELHRDRTEGRKDRLGNKILFHLTYDQWVSIWMESGVAHLKGRKKGCYCMSRIDDLGHYEVGNVFIQLGTENAAEGQRNRTTESRQESASERRGKSLSPETKAKIRAAALARVERGWRGPNAGKPLSPEHRERLRQAALRRAN